MLPQIQFIEGTDIPGHLDDAVRELTFDVGTHDVNHVLYLDRSEQEIMDNEFVQWLISDRSFEFDDDSDSTCLVIKAS
tara:strand:- start:13831 stop:14064 length:234 start_codon:yes stop_codon:yes gene_type:complete